jgi:hypothetical protein
VKDGAINATDLAKIKDEHGEVTRSYDPAYMNTVACVRDIVNAYNLSLDIKDILYRRRQRNFRIPWLPN